MIRTSQNLGITAKQSKDLDDLKAVSQNLMHSNVNSTDGVYGVLLKNNIGERMRNLSHNSLNVSILDDELLKQIEKISKN